MGTRGPTGLQSCVRGSGIRGRSAKAAPSAVLTPEGAFAPIFRRGFAHRAGLGGTASDNMRAAAGTDSRASRRRAGGDVRRALPSAVGCRQWIRGSAIAAACRSTTRSFLPRLDWNASSALLGIRQILARINHPQTNGKLERFHGEQQRKLHRFKDVAVPPGTAAPFGSEPPEADPVARFVKNYNYRRPHMSLDWDNLETPYQAFQRKMPPPDPTVAR